MRTSRAWCVELQRTVSIAEAQTAYFEQAEPRRRFSFLCADPVCRERAGTRMSAVHEDRLFFDDAYPTSAHFATVPQTPHDPLCADVLREQASAVVRNENLLARDDLNASRRFSTKQAFEVYDVYWPAVAGLLPLSAMLASNADVDPRASAHSVMPATLLASRSAPEPLVRALARSQTSASLAAPRTPVAHDADANPDDEAVRALERAIEAMARDDGEFDAVRGQFAHRTSQAAAFASMSGVAAPVASAPARSLQPTANDDASNAGDSSALAERIDALAADMRTQAILTRRLADVVACYSELGAVDRQKALIRLPGCRAMSYANFIQPLSRYQDTDEPLVRVGGARVMREERGYVLRFFERVVLDGERFEVVMRISDARIAAASMSGLLRAQLLATLGEGNHVRVFFFGGIAPDSKQHNLTQVRLSDLDNVVLQPMRVAGAGAHGSVGGQVNRSTLSSTGASASRI